MKDIRLASWINMADSIDLYDCHVYQKFLPSFHIRTENIWDTLKKEINYKGKRLSIELT